MLTYGVNQFFTKFGCFFGEGVVGEGSLVLLIEIHVFFIETWYEFSSAPSWDCFPECSFDDFNEGDIIMSKSRHNSPQLILVLFH